MTLYKQSMERHRGGVRRSQRSLCNWICSENVIYSRDSYAVYVLANVTTLSVCCSALVSGRAENDVTATESARLGLAVLAGIINELDRRQPVQPPWIHIFLKSCPRSHSISRIYTLKSVCSIWEEQTRMHIMAFSIFTEVLHTCIMLLLRYTTEFILHFPELSSK